MTDLMTQAYKEALAACPTQVVILETVQFDHADLTEPVRLVNDYADLTAKDETAATVTYTRFAFSSVLPEVNAAGSPEVVITVDNASAEIARLLDSLADSPDVLTATLRFYRSDDLEAPAGRIIPGEVRHIGINDLRVTLRLGFGQVAGLPFPGQTYTPKRFPGLVR